MRFREGRESVEDGKCSGRPQTSCTAENIEKFSVVVRKNSLQTTTVVVGMKGTVLPHPSYPLISPPKTSEYFLN
ncbi:hypothetical protein TNCV_4964421 [Trichonephila clavipes]|nr:hypothetical protein TNCV_4964421 [Trichonephila clavipes]